MQLQQGNQGNQGNQENQGNKGNQGSQDCQGNQGNHSNHDNQGNQHSLNYLIKLSVVLDLTSLSDDLVLFILKSKEPPQTFVPQILVSLYPEWANCKGFLEP